MTRATRPFAALLWKELLELTRYSVPMLVLYAVFVWLDATPPETLRQVSEPAERFVWFGFFNALVGGLLGFSQTWRESRTDTWAFAVHRPVSRHRIFAAKALAGQLTLVTIAGLPYAVAMIWTAMPGHVAVPFDWHMWQPGIADLLVGLLFHGAGMLLGSRHNSTLARVFALVAAIGVGLSTGGIQPFWGAAVAAILFCFVFLAAAWSTFISRDDPTAQPWVGRAANALTLVPGCMVLYVIVSIVAEGMVPARVPAPSGAPRAQALVTPDGEIARVTVRDEYQRHASPEAYVVTATDLDGRARPDLAAKLAVSPAGSGVLVTNQLQLERLRYGGGYRDPSRWARRLFAGERGPIWYYERRHRLISVYNDSTRRRTGWIGPDGFLPGDTMPTHRFEGDLVPNFWSTANHLLFTGAVYTSDYPQPPKLFFRAPDGDTIRDMARPSFRAFNNTGYAAGPSWSQFLAVVTNRAAYVLDTSGRVELASPHPVPLPRWASLTIWRAPNAPGRPTFVWYPAQSDSFNMVFEYRQGAAQPVARHRFPGLMFEPTQMGYSSAQALVYGGSVTSVSASTFGPAPSFMGWEIASGAEATPPSRRAIVTTLLVNAAGVLAVWLIGRRYAFSGRAMVAWIAVAVITGPFAVLLLWLTTELPAREPCPSCRKMRVVNRERCEHCGAPFTAPEPDGTEIFATSP